MREACAENRAFHFLCVSMLEMDSAEVHLKAVLAGVQREQIQFLLWKDICGLIIRGMGEATGVTWRLAEDLRQILIRQGLAPFLGFQTLPESNMPEMTLPIFFDSSM